MAHKKVNVEIEVLGHCQGAPAYEYDNDSGFDLYATEAISMGPHSRRLMPCGIKVAVPDGYELQVRSRSGKALKEGLIVLNNPGTIDAGYRGEVGAILYNASPSTKKVTIGEKVAQAVLCPVVQGEFESVAKLSDTQRGSGGFGSTDSKK